MNDLGLYHNGEKVDDLARFLRDELCDFEFIAFMKKLIINMYAEISAEKIGDEISDFVRENFDDDEKIDLMKDSWCAAKMTADMVKHFCESEEKMNNFCIELDDKSVAKIIENLRYYKRI